MADFFGVTTDYLLGRTSIEESLDDIIKKSELEILEEIHNLSPESQEEIKKIN